MIELSEQVRSAFGDAMPDMAQIFSIDGEVFREPPGAGRRTLRCELGGKHYFLKLHWGVGWREIFKNLLAFRWPVLGARNEWKAIRHLERIGVKTMALDGYGEEGWNPARLRSFVLTRELEHTISLEDYCVKWAQQPPSLRVRRGLVRRVAEMTAKMHAHGMNHRDLYICHFLLREPWDGAPDDLDLYLIDLHRVQIRARVPVRWRIKDLSALYFSSTHIGLSRQDLLRFVICYRRASARMETPRWLWQRAVDKAKRLQARRPVVPSEHVDG